MSERQQWTFGPIEFHCARNEALIDDFYRVTRDCRDAGAIVDIWLVDIQNILARHGYEMIIYLPELGGP